MSARGVSSLLAHASGLGSREPPHRQSLRRGIPDGALIRQMIEQVILTLPPAYRIYVQAVQTQIGIATGSELAKITLLD